MAARNLDTIEVVGFDSHRINYAPVAQRIRADAFEASGQGFNSLRAYPISVCMDMYYAILCGMNAEPHIHGLDIVEGSEYWYLTYGDQNKLVRKPDFRDPQKVLSSAVRKIITRHDEASIEAGEDALGFRAAMVKAREMVPTDPKRWGSEQIK